MGCGLDGLDWQIMQNMKSTTGNDNFIELNGNKYERCDKFKYLGVSVTKDNEMKEEIKARIAVGNRAYQALLKVMKSHNLSRNLKSNVYQTLIRPVVMYASETWTMATAEEEPLKRWKRKVLRKIFRATKEDGQRRIWRNRELEELYQHPNIVSEIRSNRLRWLGHIERMPEDRMVNTLGHPGGRRLGGRPCRRWMDDIEDDLQKMKIKRWRMHASDRDVWANIIPGPDVGRAERTSPNSGSFWETLEDLELPRASFRP
ncbi:hypothetical protein J437_LFUL015262 [Ladona fulva]|uniref:Endonuclease-reverse transcriptase n=1 Tax=Ladona fulva TaxID=123851 RepID=A0A8K0KR71_LADFU|nr:hypothetical protein J437_LFUL015262 [Ladona fulva]